MVCQFPSSIFIVEFSFTIVPGSGEIVFIILPEPEYVIFRFFSCFFASFNSNPITLGIVVYFISYQNSSKR